MALPPHRLREASARSQRYMTLAGGGRASFTGRRIVVGRASEEDGVVAFNWCVGRGRGELGQINE